GDLGDGGIRQLRALERHPGLADVGHQLVQPGILGFANCDHRAVFAALQSHLPRREVQTRLLYPRVVTEQAILFEHRLDAVAKQCGSVLSAERRNKKKKHRDRAFPKPAGRHTWLICYTNGWRSGESVQRTGQLSKGRATVRPEVFRNWAARLSTSGIGIC